MTSKEDIKVFSQALRAYPAAFRGNPLNLLFLDNAFPISNPKEYLWDMDAAVLIDERLEYVHAPVDKWPFPEIHIPTRPDPWELSQVLFSRFDFASTVLNRQRDLARILADTAAREDVDIIALVIVDGLSYYDVPESTNPQPFLVDGASITEVGYRAVVGMPSVSQRLFANGYHIQLGFTYFDTRLNALAGDLFSVFGTSQVHKISTFEEVFDYVSPKALSRGYVQVTMPGLDGLCHFHRDRPPRETYLLEILNRFDALFQCLKNGGRRVLACLTADHGIWWREDLEARLEVVGEQISGPKVSTRYVAGEWVRDYTLVRKGEVGTHSLLRPALLTRQLKVTEWGVHGGVSAWESLVPVILRRG